MQIETLQNEFKRRKKVEKIREESKLIRKQLCNLPDTIESCKEKYELQKKLEEIIDREYKTLTA